MDTKLLRLMAFAPAQTTSRIIPFFSIIALVISFVFAGTSLSVAIHPPAIDDFTDAANINLGLGAAGSITGSNVSATGEAGEPVHNKPQAAPLNSVWWKFTATQNGSMEFNTNGSDFDTILAAYTGSAVNALTEVASNDDFQNLQSQVTFNITAGTTYYMAVEGFSGATGSVAGSYSFTAAAIVASILPTARAIQIPGTVTAFASVFNYGTATAINCSIALPDPIAGATFLYQTTDSANIPIRTPNTPIIIPANTAQGFYFAITAAAVIASTDIELVFDCINTAPAITIKGVNTFWMTASSSPKADMVAISATVGNTGYIIIPGTTGQQLATAAVVNIGTTGTITAFVTEQAIFGTDPNMSATLEICRTDAAGTCLTGFDFQQTFTAIKDVLYFFTILATGTGTVANDPALNRAHLYFLDGFNPVGATSVAVRTAP